MNTIEREELIERVKKLNDEEKNDEVLDLLLDDILENYKDSELYNEKAYALFRLGKDIYKKYALEGLKIKENVKSLNYLGIFYITSNLEKAENYFLRSIVIDPKYHGSYTGLGYLYSKRGENDKSEEFYKKGIEVNPHIHNGYNGLGNFYLEQKKYDKAKLNYKKALNIRKNSTSYNQLGNLYSTLGEYEKAESTYQNALLINSKSPVYYNLGNLYYKLEQFTEAKENYQKFIDLNRKKDFYYENANFKIMEINKILINEDYKKIQQIISKIQDLLEYKDDCITHFTGLSTAKELILNKSKFRLSEGTYLNDTSEGMALFDYLKYDSPLNKKESHIDEIFVKKPFIGSFVSQNKHNDLIMWRMYGKEGMEEARGCALTMNKEILIEEILIEHKIDKSSSNDDNFKFYRVAYKKNNGKFILPEHSESNKVNQDLNKLCDDLKNALNEFNEKPESKDIQKDIEEILFEIAFLFKGIEYQYEHEVRLVQKGIGFEKFIDQSFKIPRVYIKLADISQSIKKITLGPKVERADEWASALYYELQNKEVDVEIHISRQPFK